MRHALADDVVDGDEGAFRLHYFLHLSSEHLSVEEKWTDQRSGKIRQTSIVRFRDQQHMSREKRADVEKSHRDFVFENNFGFHFARNDFAEQARFVFARAWLGCVRIARVWFCWVFSRAWFSH